MAKKGSKIEKFYRCVFLGTPCRQAISDKLTHLVNFCRESDIMVCELTPRHLKDDLKKYKSDQSAKVPIV